MGYKINDENKGSGRSIFDATKPVSTSEFLYLLQPKDIVGG